MSQDEQVLSIRLRRKNTGTPWGFRMHGGAEYGQPIFIQHVNPKSLSSRQGLKVNDRLLAVGNSPTHHLTHEQVKMEIIRAGNELDFVVNRNMTGVDQQDSRPAQRAQQQRPQYDEPDEESSQYRGYTNPKVQSRSFKILQESLSYTEAGEEGIILPSGHTPGEGVVKRAYTEGRRRMQELAEINPRNFIKESPIYDRGQNLLKCSEEEEDIINKLKCSYKSEPEIAQAKSYTHGSASSTTKQSQSSQSVNIAGSSVLAPAAAQKQYLEQAHAYYGDENAPTIQIVQQQPVQARVQQPVQLQPLQLQPAQLQPQQAPRRRERKRQPRAQQVTTQIQSPVSVPQASGFIPKTDTVSSVAEELNLKHESTVEQVAVNVKVGPSQAVSTSVVTVVEKSTEATVEAKPSQIQEVPSQNQSETKQNVQAVTVEQVAVNVKDGPSQAVSTSVVTVVEKSTEATAETKPSLIQEIPSQNQSETKQNVQAETVITVSPQSTVIEVKPDVDVVDATVEPSGDVIRDYGERMAETVISESLQDASTGIRDVTDGCSVSKTQQPPSKEVVEMVAETQEQIEDQKPEPDNKAGKSSEPEPKVSDAGASNESVVILAEKPAEQVEPSPSDVVVEAVNIESMDDASVSISVNQVSTEDSTMDLTTVMDANESSSAESTQTVIEKSDDAFIQAAVQETSNTETAVADVDISVAVQEASSAETVVADVEISVPEQEASSAETVAAVVDISVPVQKASSAETVVADVDISVPVQQASSAETATAVVDISVPVQKASSAETVVADVHISVPEKEASSAETITAIVNEPESVSVEENVDVSIGEAEASFVIGGGEEENSFVFSVQEENSQDVSAEVKAETFDISVDEGTVEAANITLDLSADVTIDANVPTADESNAVNFSLGTSETAATEDSTEVSISLGTSETTETVIVQESKTVEKKEEPKKAEKQSEQPAGNRTNTKPDSSKKDPAPLRKNKFVDSQGGVSARLARFNLKKK